MATEKKQPEKKQAVRKRGSEGTQSGGFAVASLWGAGHQKSEWQDLQGRKKRAMRRKCKVQGEKPT